MIIREIKPEDAKIFKQFRIDIAKETDYLLMQEEEVPNIQRTELYIKNLLKSPLEQILIVEDDNKIVGMIYTSRKCLKKIRHVGSLAIMVLKEYYGNSLTSQLMEKADEWFEKKEITRIEFDVISENKRALAFYKKHNYKQESVSKNGIFMNEKYYDLINMAKFINRK